jgi:plastocyanin domain-containing protein
MKKKAIIALGLILVVVALWKFTSKPKVEAFEFYGNVVEVKESSIVVKGNYKIGDRAELESKTIEVNVTPQTRLIRSTFERPLTGTYNPSQLPHENKPATLADLVEDRKRITVSVMLKSVNNIYGSKKITVEEITYVLPSN